MRCGHVTGVQTCALPISAHAQTATGRTVEKVPWPLNALLVGNLLTEQFKQPACRRVAAQALPGADDDGARSEERRVGEGCADRRDAGVAEWGGVGVGWSE